MFTCVRDLRGTGPGRILPPAPCVLPPFPGRGVVGNYGRTRGTFASGAGSKQENGFDGLVTGPAGLMVRVGVADTLGFLWKRSFLSDRSGFSIRVDGDEPVGAPVVVQDSSGISTSIEQSVSFCCQRGLEDPGTT